MALKMRGSPLSPSLALATILTLASASLPPLVSGLTAPGLNGIHSGLQSLTATSSLHTSSQLRGRKLLEQSHQLLDTVSLSQAPTKLFDRSLIVQLSAGNPKAFLYQGFLSDQECDHILERVAPKLEESSKEVVPSIISENEENEESDEDMTPRLLVENEAQEEKTKTEQEKEDSDEDMPPKVLIEKGSDPIVRGIEERISEWTGMPVPNQEPMQVHHFMKGQKFIPSYVYFAEDFSKMQGGGPRNATVLMFLSDVPKGGETVFSNVPDATPKDESWSDCARGVLAVKPRKGDALLFFDIRPDGSQDPYTFHHTCPILEGAQWSTATGVHVRSYDGPKEAQ